MAEHRREPLPIGEYLEIKSWALNTIKAEPEGGNKTTKSPSIFKIPQALSSVRKSAFAAEIFCFGPYYRGSELCKKIKNRHPPRLFGDMKLGDIDALLRKWTSFDKSQPLRFAEDITTDKDAQYPFRDRLDEVLRGMIDLAEEARECYDGPGQSYSSYSNFFKMIVFDGCFIVELLRWQFTNDKKKQLDASSHNSDAPIFEARWVLPTLQRDLIKLQNQIPYFFLEKLYSFTTSGKDEPSLQDLFVTFFCSMLSLDKSIYLLDPESMRKHAHPLDLFRSSFIFSMRRKREGNGEVYRMYIDNPKLIYSAQDLQEAGVTIIRRDNCSLLDISFDLHTGVLQIPPLSIDENMIAALLNFAAYEQGDQSKKPYFINYLLFLDSLINTIKDIEILRKNRIIWYALGTEQEVVDLFNNFSKVTVYSFDQTYMSVNMNDVNKYCDSFYNSKRRFWWSNLKRERFSSPWTFLSLLAAIVLLILTMVQTFFSIFPYYHPN